MLLSGLSYIIVNTSREEGDDIQLRFATTVANGLIAIGKGLTFYLLELISRRFFLDATLSSTNGHHILSHLFQRVWKKCRHLKILKSDFYSCNF